jgi:ferritin-like metal-binding protein YciE
MPKKLNSLEDLFVDTLKDLYSAEHQIMKALPKMAKAANNEDLRQGLNQHLEQTKKQAERIEQIFNDGNADGIQGKPGGKKCVGMEGLLKEGDELLAEDAEPDVRDAGIIAAAQKVEHYEISGYGTARTFAQMLGYRQAVKLLQQTLDEEAQTDKKLTAMAESHINRQAEM